MAREEHRTNEDFRQALRELDVSQREFAEKWINTDYTAVNRWALGKAKVPGVAWAYIDLRLELKRLNEKGRG
jgi:DNA-binding transcriptional regulator YiaG